MTVGEIVGEPLIVHHLASPKQTTERVAELLKLVGLNPLMPTAIRTNFRVASANGGCGACPFIAARVDCVRRADFCLDVSIQAQW